MKKTLCLRLSRLFMLLTFAGAGYVLYTKGHANAGYALVPLLFQQIFLQAYRSIK